VGLSFVYSGDWDGTRVEGVPVWNDFGIAARMLAESPDFGLLLGDTIVSDPAYASTEARTFEEYCAVYRMNRGYENLRALMAGIGTYWISDDHEYVDNFAGAAPDVDADRFAAALKAFRVNNPVPKWSKTHGFFRTFRWGKHAEFFVLDERTLRTGNVTDDYAADPLPTVPAAIREMAGLPAEIDPEIALALADPERSILGRKQKKKFLKALLASDATWKFVINEVAIAEQFFLPYDRWEGYSAERFEILEFIAENEIGNVVFLTTDLHGNQVLDVRLSALAGTPVIAREFICGPAADATIRQELDATFGKEAAAQAIGLMEMLNPPRFAEYDSFAYTHVAVDAESGNATFTIKNEEGEVLYSATLEP
jgi:phosphodiesterase/alkaline phosphatase D-like protein